MSEANQKRMVISTSTKCLHCAESSTPWPMLKKFEAICCVGGHFLQKMCCGQRSDSHRRVKKFYWGGQLEPTFFPSASDICDISQIPVNVYLFIYLKTC